MKRYDILLCGSDDDHYIEETLNKYGEWCKYEDCEILISKFNDEINDIKNEKNNLQDTIIDLRQEIKNLKDTIIDLQKEIKSLEKQIENLESED